MVKQTDPVENNGQGVEISESILLETEVARRAGETGVVLVKGADNQSGQEIEIPNDIIARLREQLGGGSNILVADYTPGEFVHMTPEERAGAGVDIEDEATDILGELAREEVDDAYREVGAIDFSQMSRRKYSDFSQSAVTGEYVEPPSIDLAMKIILSAKKKKIAGDSSEWDKIMMADTEGNDFFWFPTLRANSDPSVTLGVDVGSNGRIRLYTTVISFDDKRESRTGGVIPSVYMALEAQ